MTNSTDIQCQAILTGLVGLGDILELPLANTALDLADNAGTSKHKDLLLRLKNSLTQYLQRTGDLVYIALIGHFSSGKSSTLNSLLEIWEKGDQRQVGLNPTDKVITLITHEDNANSLLGIVSQGSVPFRVQPIKTDIVRDIVFADTPGTGDPHLVEEMARDFLPICDLVLFFLSAASPLDSTDIPLLSELHRRLPFIPLMFVITRADELRSDSGIPVSNSNFDNVKAAAFIAEVMSRITLLMQPAAYNDNDFCLIDNKAAFNIEKLRRELLARADPTNIANRLTMHSHKVNFFLKTSESVREFFASFLDKKLAELNRIVAAAESNIDKYNESVIIANSNLTKSWFDQNAAIQDIKAKANDRIKKSHDLPASLFDSERIAKSISDLNLELARTADVRADEVEKYTMQTTFQQLRRETSHVQRNLNDADLDTLTPQDHGLIPIVVHWTFGDTDIIPQNLLSIRADSVRFKIRDLIEDMTIDLARSLEDIRKSVQQRYAIAKCEEIVQTAQISLAYDLDSYFQNVHVYRAGVFAMTTKASIAKLGIGRQLDQLETEFTEEDRDSIKIQVRQALFPAFDEVLASAATQMTSILENISVLLGEVKGIRVETPPSCSVRLQGDASTQFATLFDDIKNQIQSEVNDFVGELQTRLAAAIGIKQSEYDKELSVALKARRIRYASVTALVGVFGVIGYIIYHSVTQPVGQSLIEILGWGILVEIIGNMLGLGFVRFFQDNFPETKRRIKERNSAALADEVRRVIDESTKDHQFSVLQRTVLGKKLSKIYTDLTSPQDDPWQRVAVDQYRSLRTFITRYHEIRSNYLGIIEGVATDCGRYFDDAEQNLQTLKSTAYSIKERAIEPSFNLLAETSKQLREVRDQIAGIRFS